METWRKAIADSITTPEELAEFLVIDPEPLVPLIRRYPMRITRRYLRLIGKPGDAIWRQCVPDPREFDDDQLPDPLDEERLSPVPGLIHRYPDRVVWLVSNECAVYCRFCMRKRRVGCPLAGSNERSWDDAVRYIAATPAIRDVILSGGDPLLLDDERLETILARLRTIPHVEMIRIGTRTPVTLPERITARLCRMLKRYHPLYVNTHFNHPREITPEATKACARLADAGIPLGNQTVLLAGVNDEPAVMTLLMQRLLAIRVRPYYIHQMDLVRGTGHFRTTVATGLDIMGALRGHTSGMATPYFVIDAAGGKGKIPLIPDAVERRGDTWLLRNYRGEIVEYQDR
ncbi:KamA family radical SAM protein [Geobacter hydrogenophilus]|uniref:Lysine 2,3-aminomutase n=1 Tax=Geobacter hydrogenophilus TaxID=40983 RepID=A0A9W6LDI9_9BACT|nr:KamA family radical SAM protein [Geobacter hydrogenophilus]MBT0893143.1 KamA family radical SAM protein [Geobacter hydrogenophilus]GLI39015.1 lysine 2,3-aminomutase [Geobacter hydrogenophilus]